MADRSIRDRMPPADSMWQCPCGRVDTYAKLIGHRNGWRKRPACKGQIRPLDDSLLYTEVVEKLQVQEAPSPIEPVIAQEEESPEDTDLFAEDLTDPEAIARALNQQFHSTEPDIATLARLSAPGAGRGSPGTLPPGEWSADKGVGPLAVSEDRISLTLPVMHRLMYDWAVAQGWRTGDGSFSAFVDDLLLDYYRSCWGVGLFVAPLEDINDPRLIGPRLEAASPSPNA